MKMAVAIDLTKQPERTEFSGSSKEDMSYAKTFWQSIQLHPPMESRLVSSDIKQRLKRAPVGAQSVNYSHSATVDQPDNRGFLVRAKTLEHMEEFGRLQRFTEARDKELQSLHMRRKEREEKERKLRGQPKRAFESLRVVDSDEEVDLREDEECVRDLDLFKTTKYDIPDSDSD
ncbi:hypothetical protein ScPMuIL_006016 [Solemya velum]